MRIFVKFVGVRTNLYRKLFPEAADWDLTNQLVASVIDVMRHQWWLRCGGDESGSPPPDPIDRPGIKKRKGDHRRGNAPRSETNKVLGMRLDSESDPKREEKLRNLFGRGQRGPIRDLSKINGPQAQRPQPTSISGGRNPNNLIVPNTRG